MKKITRKSLDSRAHALGLQIGTQASAWCPTDEEGCRYRWFVDNAGGATNPRGFGTLAEVALHLDRVEIDRQSRVG